MAKSAIATVPAFLLANPLGAATLAVSGVITGAAGVWYYLDQENQKRVMLQNRSFNVSES